jgi:multiple sugar transport system permease protein
MSVAASSLARLRRRIGLSKAARREALLFYLCISPWLIGFIAWQLGPMLVSLYISFARWDLLSPPHWVGLRNYVNMFTNDPLYIQSLKVTFTYALFELPLAQIVALLAALLVNQKVPGINYFRTIFYMPSLVTGVGIAVLWLWIFNPDFGILNVILSGIVDLLHLPIKPSQLPGWVASPDWALPAFVIMGLWGFGNTMVIYLAGLKGIPQQLYEAAEIDGATWWTKFWRVTIPMLSPSIFFNVVLGVIGVFQTFDTAYVMTRGGPDNATLFYVMYLYQKAFGEYKMGYASAQAWILFLIIMAVTLIVVKTSKDWVYYEGARR